MSDIFPRRIQNSRAFLNKNYAKKGTNKKGPL
jgi:hypothetical protein